MEKKENLHEGHFKRLRMQFLKSPESFAEHQLVEFILTFISVRKDVNPLAHRLVSKFGSAKNVIYASKDDLMQVDGVTERIATYITRFPNLLKIYADSNKDSLLPLSTTQSIVDYTRGMYDGINKDDMILLLLTFDDELMAQKIFRTRKMKNGNTLFRDIVHFSLLRHCKKFLIIRKSDDINCFPTDEDIVRAANLLSSSKIIDYVFKDYIILFPNGNYVSFKENGFLEIISAMKYYTNNFYSSLLSSEDAKNEIIELSLSYKNPKFSQEEKLIIAACRSIVNILMKELF